MPYKNKEDEYAYTKRYRALHPEWARAMSRRSMAKYRKKIGRDVVNQKQRDRYQELREQIINGYGGACSCCGEPERSFLAVDHVNDDGKKDRSNVTGFYLRIVREGFPLDYQLLCHNCNYGRYLNGGMCPHKTRADNESSHSRSGMYRLTL